MPNRGFTLIEVVVALLIAVGSALGMALLAQSGLHHRAVTDASSIATSLASKRLEMLLALQVPASDPDLTAGTHGPMFLDAEAEPSIGGPFSVQWDVADGVPFAGSKKITVTVIHALEESARARLVTYLKTS